MATLALVLAGCTRTTEPVEANAAASTPMASSTHPVWADAALAPVLEPLVQAFRRDTGQSVNIRYSDPGPLRQAIHSVAGAAAALYVGAAVPPPDEEVLVVHPGEAQNRSLGLPANTGRRGDWQTPQWLWRDHVCSVGPLPLTPATAMGQWQRQAVTLAADFEPDGLTPGEPVRRVLAKAESLQPGVRAMLLAKLRRFRAQAPQQTALAAVQARRADLAILPCAQARTGARSDPGLKVTPLPPALTVTLDYGLALRTGADEPVRAFARYLQSDAALAQARQLGLHRLDAR